MRLARLVSHVLGHGQVLVPLVLSLHHPFLVVALRSALPGHLGASLGDCPPQTPKLTSSCSPVDLSSGSQGHGPLPQPQA